MVVVHNNTVTYRNEDNTSNSSSLPTLSYGFTRYTGGSSTSGSYYFRYYTGSNSSYWVYGKGTSEITLKFVIKNESGIVSAYIYNTSDTLVAQPGSTSSVPLSLDFSSVSLDDITVVLGHFNNNGADRYTKFDVISLNVEKTIQ